MAIKIITDSTSYIDKELLDKYDIEVLSLFVTFDQTSIKETDIDNATFYKRMDKEGIPTSSQPSLGEIEVRLRAQLEKGNDIIGVFISSEMSGTYNSVVIVKDMLLEEYPERRITIIDSKSNSMQLGFAVLNGARLAYENKDYDDILNGINKTIETSRFLFIPKTLNYLQKGGRIGKAGALVGNALKITPILTVDEGITHVYKSVRTQKRAVQSMLDTMMEVHQEKGVKEVCIHHINALDAANELKEAVLKQFDVNVIVSSIGPVIGLHVGPGALGIVYYT